MTIEISAFIVSVVFVATSLIAKALERRQDVLYGPYIEGQNARRPFEGVVDLLEQAGRALRPPVALLTWKMRNASSLASAIIG
jgi:hypothetical protein